MIPNPKVSQKKTSSSGERDVSARATHLKAAIGKVSMTTIERKRMSTKTTIKRIALVAAASLGLGVLSVVPAQAAVSGLAISVTNGTKVLGATTADTATGAVVNITGLTSVTSDTVAVTITNKVGTGVQGNLFPVDTAVSGTVSIATETITGRVVASGAALANRSWAGLSTPAADSITAISGGTSAGAWVIGTPTTTGYFGGRFRLALDPTVTGTIPAGTYTFTITATPYVVNTTNNTHAAGTPVSADVSIVVAASASSGSTSTAYIGAGSTAATFNSDTLTVVSTASNTTPVANYAITLLASDGTSTGVAESVTATTTVGNVGAIDGSILGRNVQLTYTAGSTLRIGIFGDGTTGTASVCAKTATITFPCKTVIFYSTTAAALTATQVASTLAVGSNSGAFRATATDASGNWIPTTTSVYIFSDNTAVVSETASNCSVDTANSRMSCTLTGVAPGTANIMFGTNTAKANATAAFKVTVTSNAIASIALTSNKTSYAPGEVAYIRVTAKDSAGNSVAPQTIANFFTSTGITTDVGLGANSATISGTSVTLAAQTTSGYATGDAVAQFTVYMPTGASSITFSAKGGAGLPAAAQTATSLTVAVADSGSQALAAVTALASQVSAFITKINAQITTLTDLVMKIQKKVKA